jgi:hypothetical protein
LILKIAACPALMGRLVQRGHRSLASINGRVLGVVGVEPERVGGFHYVVGRSRPVDAHPARA